jgi:hypothetical protein
MDAREEITATANWVLSGEGQAACRAAWEFAQRTGIGGTLSMSEVCALVVAAHEAEVRARKADPQTDDQETRS